MLLDFSMTFISWSRVKLWRRCQMAHHYRYYQKLKRRAKPRPLMLGSAVHLMIEQQIETGSWDLTPVETEYNKLFSEEKAEIGDIPGDTRRIVTSYFEYYKNDRFEYPKVWFGRNTELHVKVDLGNKVIFHGYIDSYPLNELGYWVCDHKTHRNLPDEATRYSDLQTVMYVWAAREMGLPKPIGVLWDYIRTKAPSIPEILKNGEISMRKNIDTTPEVYLATVKEHLGEIPPKYIEFARGLEHKRQDFFSRVRLPSPSPRLIDTVIRDLRETGREIQEFGEKAVVRTMSRDCARCSYFPVCSAEVRGLDSKAIRATLYEVRSGNQEEVNDDADGGTAGGDSE